MTQLLEQIINGLVLGGIYALIAVGYTMVYGIIQLINFTSRWSIRYLFRWSLTFGVGGKRSILCIGACCQTRRAVWVNT